MSQPTAISNVRGANDSNMNFLENFTEFDQKTVSSRQMQPHRFEPIPRSMRTPLQNSLQTRQGLNFGAISEIDYKYDPQIIWDKLGGYIMQVAKKH